VGYILLYCLSPVFALPFILFGIKDRRKWAVVAFALFLGTIAYLTIPLQDLFRHLEHYETFSEYDFKDITDVQLNLNGIILYVYVLMGKLHIPFDFLRLFTISSGFYMLFSIFNWKMEHTGRKYSSKAYFIRFLVLTFFFDLFYTISGVRYGYALCLYLFGTHHLFITKKWVWGILFLLLAIGFHSSFLYLIVATYGLYFVRINKKTMILLGVLTFVGMTIFFQKYSYLLGLRSDWYLSESSTVGDYSNMTVNGMIGFFLPKVFVLPFAHILIKYFDPKSKWMRLSLAWFVVAVVCMWNAVFFYRIWWGFMATGIYMFLDYEDLTGIAYRKARVLLYSSVCFALFSLIPAYQEVTHSDYVKLIEPAPMIFSHHTTVEEVLQKVPNAEDI